MKIDILPNIYLKKDGTYDIEKALVFGAHCAGVCYNEEGFYDVQKEDIKKTKKRVEDILKNGHHSVLGHQWISFNMQEIPKILAMIINNENVYATSEKSGRYTNVAHENEYISSQEVKLYNKWMNIFQLEIKKRYGHVFNERKIKKLAQENARYLINVFMPTQMIYSTSLRQLNYMVSWMKEFINNDYDNIDFSFKEKINTVMEEFIEKMEKLNVLTPGLMKNEKNRSLSMFGKNLLEKTDFFDLSYSTTYKGSWAEFAQAQRHRTIDYQLEIMGQEFNCFIPPIIQYDSSLVAQWQNDMYQIKNNHPQGEIIIINEMGKFDDLIMKCKERLCSEAQLEIMRSTKKTLEKYYNSELNANISKEEIEKYIHGARCTFPDFKCSSDCQFVEGKKLTRMI